MNSQERTSGGFRREKRSIPKAWLHATWLFGMTAALALGWLGTSWIRERVQETNSAAQMERLARLDAEARPFLEQAHKAIPEIVSEITRFPNLFRLWKRLARDRLCGTQTAQEFLSHFDSFRLLSASLCVSAGMCFLQPVDLKKNEQMLLNARQRELNLLKTLFLLGGGFSVSRGLQP